MTNKLLITAVVVALLVGTSRGATWRQLLPKHPRISGCVDPTGDFQLEVGETMQAKGICGDLTCGEYSQDKYILEGRSCGVIAFAPSEYCREVPEDPNGTYPDCCADIECDYQMPP